MLAHVLHYEGAIPDGFAAASALITSIKNERDKWTMSALGIDEIRSLGYTGDDPVTRADFEELVATQIVRIPTTHEVAICSFN